LKIARALDVLLVAVLAGVELNGPGANLNLTCEAGESVLPFGLGR
jgi:hypothetical protein